MDPITTALLTAAGASALAGGAGFALGRRGRPEPKPPPPAAPGAERALEAPSPREQRLEQENRTLRALFGLEPGAARPDSALLGDHLDALREHATGLRALKTTRQLVWLTSHGELVQGDASDARARALGALLGATQRLGVWEGGCQELQWRGERGAVLSLHAIELAGRQRVFLGLWSVGLEAPREALARMRHGLEGASAQPTPRARMTLGAAQIERAPAPRPDLAGRIVERAPVVAMSVRMGQMSLFEAGEFLVMPEREPVWRLLEYADFFAQSHAQLVGALDGVWVRGPLGQLGAHPVRSPKGQDCALLLELEAGPPYPHERLEGWCGQLAWQLPGLIEASQLPMREETPAKPRAHTKRPETLPGGAR